MAVISHRSHRLQETMSGFLTFFNSPIFEQAGIDPEACDFMVGNPHEMPLPGFVEALQSSVIPQDKEWFAYKMNEERPRQVLAENLTRTRGMAFDPQDIFPTTGAFGALAVTLNAIIDPGDEVIYISPPWFFYETLIVAAGGKPVRVKITPETFDLDISAIQAAITSSTRAIIVNSPNNPTGKIYQPETLTRLSDVLTVASQRNQRPIYLLSDEAYCRIIYDGRSYHSPTNYYPDSFLIYTYGKTLLTPGQRLGYIALPPGMSDVEAMRPAIFASQFTTAYAIPNALLQHALPDLEKLSIDIEHLQEKRDRLVSELSQMGYQLHAPEGTFYLLPRSPLKDDWAFINLLAEQHIYCLPGSVCEMPGYFRISITANDDMVERALPGFERAMELAKQQDLVQA
ncbi:MAG: aminotransferase class I/II-fold pyridoxal phosphate-dependent enzyme, partial [Anaerolineales bacterium]